jgi:hypothetical protein
MSTVLHKKNATDCIAIILYSVVRAQKELDESGSFFGAIFDSCEPSKQRGLFARHIIMMLHIRVD